MPWERIIEVGTASGILGTALVLTGSRFFVTKKEKSDCQKTLCSKIDKVAQQIETNKLEMIGHRDKSEEKLSAKVEINRKVVSDHYSEVKHSLGVIQGQLGVIERIINGSKK